MERKPTGRLIVLPTEDCKNKTMSAEANASRHMLSFSVITRREVYDPDCTTTSTAARLRASRAIRLETMFAIDCDSLECF